MKKAIIFMEYRFQLSTGMTTDYIVSPIYHQVMPPTDMADEGEGFKKGTSYFSISIISTTLGGIKNILNTTSAIESLMKGHQITKIPNQNDRQPDVMGNYAIQEHN